MGTQRRFAAFAQCRDGEPDFTAHKREVVLDKRRVSRKPEAAPNLRERHFLPAIVMLDCLEAKLGIEDRRYALVTFT